MNSAHHAAQLHLYNTEQKMPQIVSTLGTAQRPHQEGHLSSTLRHHHLVSNAGGICAHSEDITLFAEMCAECEVHKSLGEKN